VGSSLQAASVEGILEQSTQPVRRLVQGLIKKSVAPSGGQKCLGVHAFLGGGQGRARGRGPAIQKGNRLGWVCHVEA